MELCRGRMAPRTARTPGHSVDRRGIGAGPSLRAARRQEQKLRIYAGSKISAVIIGRHHQFLTMSPDNGA